MRAFVVSAAILLWAPGAGAQTTILVPTDLPTIQNAIDAATAGDTVLVEPGVYVETLNFMGKAITLVSLAGADVTTIDGASAGTVITFDSGEGPASRLEGFTVTGGTGTPLLQPGPDSIGGAVYCLEAAPSLISCHFVDNSAGEGAHVGVVDAPSSVTISGCTFVNGFAFDGSGGGLHSTGGPVEVTDCLFDGNIGTAGGAVYIDNNLTGSPLAESIVTNCRFENNVGLLFAGALYASLTTLSLSDCVFSENEGMVGAGAAVICCGSEAVVTRCDFVENEAGSFGGAILADLAAFANFDRCLFAGNSTLLYGGAVHTSVNVSVLNFTHCVFWDNSANTEGAVRVEPTCSLTLLNSIVWGNGSQSVDGAGAIDISYCDIEGGFAGPGNLSSPPLFQDPGSGDFTLDPASPCINSGDPASPLDSDGTVADMGIFPAIEELFSRGDANGDQQFDLADPVSTLLSLFVVGTSPPGCLDAADVNDDGDLDVSDPVYALAALFIFAAPPVQPPFPGCGTDSTADTLFCDAYVCP